MKIERNIRLISILNFFTDFIFFAPVAIIYFSHITGSYALGMSIFSVAYVSAAIFEIPTGIISDIVGRKTTTILGAASALSCLVLYALAGNYWILFTGALFQGLSRAFYSGNNDALLYDTLKQMGKEEEYHVYLGRTGSMFQIALAIASFLGGFLAAKSFALLMWLSVLPQIGALSVSFMLVNPKSYQRGKTNIYKHLKESLLVFKTNSKLKLLSFANITRFSFGESAFFLNSAFINSLWPLWAVGISYTFSFIGGSLSYWFSGRLINKFGQFKILKYSTIYARIAGFAGLTLKNIFSPLIMATSSLTFGLLNVSENSLMQREFTAKQRATTSSINSFFGNIAFGLASILMGFIADKFGVVIALFLTQFMLLVPLLVYKKIFANVSPAS